MSEGRVLKTAAELRAAARDRQRRSEQKKRENGMVKVSFWCTKKEADVIRKQLKNRHRYKNDLCLSAHKIDANEKDGFFILDQ